MNSLLNRINSSRLRSIDYFRRHPQEVQEQTLFNLLSRAKNTEYGQLNGFSRFKSIADFQQGLPVMEYEDFKPYIDRMRSGEENLLWPGKISWFAKSSGTTQNKSKFIPVSREGLNGCHFRGSRDVIAIYFDLYPKNGLFRGKGLTLGGSHQVDTLSGSSRYGDLSAILLQNQLWWTDFIRTPSQRVALIP
ncbi:MAG TPA: GH3 auxin-responsive promoter family protein, partial [Tenuifilaceae bacterium]|nr:GH3 auxin-responsive promoter family protein [Tenuifilaceae bacterium]